MTEILPQEVWYAEFPFEENANISKDRPVIVMDVDDENCAVFSMKVTSRAPRGEFEIEIFDWADIPLNHRSTADASKVIEIRKDKFRRKAGLLSDNDWQNVKDLHASYLKSIGFY